MSYTLSAQAAQYIKLLALQMNVTPDIALNRLVKFHLADLTGANLNTQDRAAVRELLDVLQDQAISDAKVCSVHRRATAIGTAMDADVLAALDRDDANFVRAIADGLDVAPSEALHVALSFTRPDTPEKDQDAVVEYTTWWAQRLVASSGLKRWIQETIKEVGIDGKGEDDLVERGDNP